MEAKAFSGKIGIPLACGMVSWGTGGYFLAGLLLPCGVNPARGWRTALRADRLSRMGNRHNMAASPGAR